MKKILSFIFIFVLAASCAFAYGQDVNWIVEPVYDDIGDGFDTIYHMRPVSKGGKWGYINVEGKTAIDFIFDEAEAFSEGLAYVSKDGVTGFIDNTGNIVIELDVKKYLGEDYMGYVGYYGTSNLKADEFSDGAALLRDPEGIPMFYIDKEGNKLNIPVYKSSGSFSGGLAAVVYGEEEQNSGYVDKSGKMVISNLLSASDLNDGLGAVAYRTGEKEYRVGIIDATGKFVADNLPYDSYSSEGVVNGYLTVLKYEKSGGKMLQHAGVIDKNGRQIIPAEYYWIWDYHDGLFGVRDTEDENYRIGFMDTTGQWVIEPKFKAVSSFTNGLASATMSYDSETGSSNIGLINKSGEFVIDPVFEGLILDVDYDVACGKQNGKWGLFTYEDLKEREPVKVTAIEFTGEDVPDEWAKAETYKAVEAGIVPYTMCYDYKSNITRKDFCNLIVRLVEKSSGKKSAEILKEKGISQSVSPFTDTADVSVKAAYDMGLVKGKGSGIFSPDGHITRQEAAIMLTNAAEFMSMDTEAQKSTYSDKAAIADWAASQVDFVSSKGIMNGSGGYFNPSGKYTRQQAYITVYRLLEALNK